MTTQTEQPEVVISPDELKRANNALDKAKLQLISLKKSVFTTTLLFSLKFQWDASIPTANVDGITLRINPTFFLSLTPPQRVFLLAHEAWHVAFEHITRFHDMPDGCDFKTFNEAADHVINLMLKDKKYDVPDGACCNNKYWNMSTEQVYRDLMLTKSQDPDFIPDFTPSGTSEPSEGESDPSAGASHEAMKQKIDEMLVKANTASKMNPDSDGCSEDVPDSIAERIEELINPKVDWVTLTRNFMFDLIRDDYSYKRPNKRYMPSLIIPSLHSVGMGKIGVGIDVSGSVSDAQFNCFKGEISQIKDVLNPECTEVIQWHHNIADITEVDRYEDLSNIKFKESGGTNIYPLLEHWIENPPVVAVIFTDGYFRGFDKPELINFPVLWIIYDNKKFKSPFGSIIEYEPDLN
jgi:predicted metal-dependent peptidase